jgi:hypothetical protein
MAHKKWWPKVKVIIIIITIPPHNSPEGKLLCLNFPKSFIGLSFLLALSE